MFDWKANTGALGLQTEHQGSSTVQWTAISCVPNGVKPTIEVTVTNSAGLSAQQRFEVAWNGPACGHPPCDVRLDYQMLTLQGDCVTDTPVFIPNIFTLDGAGRALMAVDPIDKVFAGAIVRNRGGQASVRSLKLKAQLMKSGACGAGDDLLAGIRLQDASGSVLDSEVLNIRRSQPSSDSPDGLPGGCQEGLAVMVSSGKYMQNVVIGGNRLSGYQKTGIVASGLVRVDVSKNEVSGAGPVSHIAQNGIQLGYGATGLVYENKISNHAYLNTDAAASGILVAGDSSGWVRDASLQRNALTNNDIGIYLDQVEMENGLVTPTQIKVSENTLRSDAVTRMPRYRAGIYDSGGGNILYSNTFTGGGYDPAKQPGASFDVDVEAGIASKVAFLRPPSAIMNRSNKSFCSSEAIVQSQDSNANLSKPTSKIFKLKASHEGAVSGITFHLDRNCKGREISTVELSTPESTASFYVKGSGWGTVNIAVSNGGLEGSTDMNVRLPYQ